MDMNTTETTDTTEAKSEEQPTVTMQQLAVMLQCSYRHVKRMRAWDYIGPAALRVGGLVRYPKAEIQEWLKAGCPNREKWVERQGRTQELQK